MTVMALSGAGLIVVIVVAALVAIAVLALLGRMAFGRRRSARREKAAEERRERRAHERRVEGEHAAVEEKAAAARAERAQAEAQLAHARQVELEAEQRRESFSSSDGHPEQTGGEEPARETNQGQQGERHVRAEGGAQGMREGETSTGSETPQSRS